MRIIVVTLGAPSELYISFLNNLVFNCDEIISSLICEFGEIQTKVMNFIHY